MTHIANNKLICLLYLVFSALKISKGQALGPSDQPEAYFNGSAYIRLQTTVSLKYQTSLSFRTCVGGDLFSQQYNDNIIELSVKEAGVFFNAKTSGKMFEVILSGDFLNNKWHTAHFYYKMGNLTLTVDDESQLLANTTYQSELLNNQDLYNDGAVLIVGKHFNGCILEGPSIVFNRSFMHPHNVQFGTCLLPFDSCDPDMRTSQAIDYCKTEPCMRHGTCINGKTTYTCVCSPRYTGKNCEIDFKCTPGFTGVKCEINVNDCQSDPCLNNGVCIDGENNYTCDCANTGFGGQNCEIDSNECSSNPCKNHGTCFNTYGSYTCLCPMGFDGDNCEVNMNDCSSVPCMNNGQCIARSGSFECLCPSGYSGLLCEIETHRLFCGPNTCPSYTDCIEMANSHACICKADHPGVFPNCSIDAVCTNNPCLNGGSCLMSMGSYSCSCPPGFTGSVCDHIELCQRSSCLNGGTCIQNFFSYHCICPEEFRGPSCEQRLQCMDKPCSHAVKCEDFIGGYYCTCEPGWTGMNCATNINECLDEPCLNGGTCIDQHNYYMCQCPPGFAGKRCQLDIDECVSQPCLNGGTCVNKIDEFYCNCTDQWMGAICERPYDICETRPCFNNATCIASSNKRDFSCACLDGFEGQLCQFNIDDCIGVSCPTGKMCVDLVGAYECRCPQGLTGENCSIDISPCSRQTCLNGGTCEDNHSTNDFICKCPPGYTGKVCEVINLCEQPGICNKGICVANNGTFQCYCMPGFTGERCNLDFDECLSMPCRNNATCLNKINNFKCVCPPGYTGKDCSVDIDECESQPCSAGSTCIDGIDKYTCICQAGLTGDNCDIDIDECSSSPCLNGAQCIDALNSYSCNCTNTGFTGIRCEINIDDCKGNPCINEGLCIDDINDYHCNCYAGYTGKDCEQDVNECESEPCRNNGTCLERSNVTLYHLDPTVPLNVTLPETFYRPFEYKNAAGYDCLCVPGTTGPNCEININECESSPCITGTCYDEVGGYKCECEEGFEGVHCENDINECEKYNPCVHGTCSDRRASYYCDCPPEYGGKNCSVELRGCLQNKCLNNGTCKPYLVIETEHKFNCSCPNGFHGPICEKRTTMSVSGHSLVTVNTSREEGYDIQFRFKTTLGNGLLALGKGSTYYILELSRGRLNLHSSLLNKWEGIFVGSNLNDSTWQKVFVAINSSHLVLSANEEQTIYPITFNENYNVTSTSFPTTYIGGFPSNLRKLTHSQPFLVGCLEDVIINSEWVLPELQNTTWLSFQDVEVGCDRQPQCNATSCHSGGHCTDLWRDFSCTCKRPYLGRTCEYNYTAATFGYENITDSLVTVTVADAARRAVRTIVDISMFIRTRQSRGQIFYLGSMLGSTNDETYIAAQLESGELLVRIQFNGTPEAYTVGGVKLNDGYDHLIEVIRNVTFVQVKLNGSEYFRKTISATGPLDAQILFLGGQPQQRLVRQADSPVIISKSDVNPTTVSAAVTTPLSMIHFKGIIQDVQISNGSKTMVVEFFPLNVEKLNIPPSFGTISFDNATVFEGVLSDDSCKINPCYHNGVCVNTWNDYRCNCTSGFKGKDCTEQEFCEVERCPVGSECKNLEDSYECIANATFNGKMAPLRYTLNLLSSKKLIHFDSIELTYRTRSWGTILFAQYSENYFVIFIYYDEVVIGWSLNGKPVSKRFQREHFEGQWITLYLGMKDSVMRGGFKERVTDELFDFEEGDFDSVNFTEIFAKGFVYIAGSDNKTFDYWSVLENTADNMTSYVTFADTTTDLGFLGNTVELPENSFTTDLPSPIHKGDANKANDWFKGCLGEIRIGSLLLPYYTTEELYPRIHPDEYFELADLEANRTVGCFLCYDSDCFNGGFCIDPKLTYNCKCLSGYVADDCSIDINECENNDCQNNATCIDQVAKYECRCLPGYEGIHCEKEIDECLSNPCQNEGTCLDLLNAFKCECPEDFDGEQCEKLKLITCDDNPCKESVLCKDGKNTETGNNFTCTCKEGYTGDTCDLAYCMPNKCLHGDCNTTGERPFCHCHQGYEGELCEININDCILSTGNSPCQNGGVCIDGVNRYDCNCTGTGYSGLLCENDINECRNRNACGRMGQCINLPGSYRCTCETGKCGYECALDEPCMEKICEHGSCASMCTDQPDYNCTCESGWEGKNCTVNKLASQKGKEGVNILVIIIPIVIAITVGLIAALIILVNIARSKRATRGTYSPSAQEFCNPRVELDHVLKPPPEERLI